MITNLRTFDYGASERPFPVRISSPLALLPTVRTLLASGFSTLALLLAATGAASAQSAGGSGDDPSYRKEMVYGVNFNTQGGLIGGLHFRSSKVLSQDWLRFWSLEAVEVKGQKEDKFINPYTGGAYVPGKTNYFYVLRPSVGLQRVIFRKAAESGVQVNALASAGPSIGLLMPYYVYYDYTLRDGNGNPIAGATQDIREAQYDPNNAQTPIDRAPLFRGASEIKPTVGAHLRGALSFEYGRYRDAVAGVETGFLLEVYTKRLEILRDNNVPSSKLNKQFYPSVYLTIYLGHRS